MPALTFWKIHIDDERINPIIYVTTPANELWYYHSLSTDVINMHRIRIQEGAPLVSVPMFPQDVVQSWQIDQGMYRNNVDYVVKDKQNQLRWVPGRPLHGHIRNLPAVTWTQIGDNAIRRSVVLSKIRQMGWMLVDPLSRKKFGAPNVSEKDEYEYVLIPRRTAKEETEREKRLHERNSPKLQGLHFFWKASYYYVQGTDKTMWKVHRYGNSHDPLLLEQVSMPTSSLQALTASEVVRSPILMKIIQQKGALLDQQCIRQCVFMVNS